jgi:hypothetical protein
MMLSETEKKMVVRLRKEQESFLRLRWVGLLGSIGSIGVAIYGFANLIRHFNKPEMSSLLVATWLLPQLYLLAIAGSLILGYVVRYWRGNPRTILLLKLLDQSKSD